MNGVIHDHSAHSVAKTRSRCRPAKGMERGCKGTGSVRKTEALCLHLAHSLMFTEARQVKVAPAALCRRQAERQCPLLLRSPPRPLHSSAAALARLSPWQKRARRSAVAKVRHCCQCTQLVCTSRQSCKYCGRAFAHRGGSTSRGAVCGTRGGLSGHACAAGARDSASRCCGATRQYAFYEVQQLSDSGHSSKRSVPTCPKWHALRQPVCRRMLRSAPQRALQRPTPRLTPLPLRRRCTLRGRRAQLLLGLLARRRATQSQSGLGRPTGAQQARSSMASRQGC